ncbi:MAG TPA: peptidylprolyl isomerase [Acidothermaceae bacterium]|nr:peptidylprolyl isomerase [Acidothermaceae bacterium]
MRRVPVRLSIIGLVAASGVALTACAPVHAGAAATVGDDRISVSALQSLVNRTLADPTFAAGQGANTSNVQRQELTTLVTRKLLAVAAQQKNVSVSEGEVSQTLSSVRQQEGSQEALDKDAARNGIAPSDVHDYFYYALLEQKLAPKISTPVVHTAHILVKDKATAEKILAQVKADPSSFADIAKSQSIDTGSAPNGGDLGTVPSAQFVTPFADAVDAAQVGSYFVVQSSFGWHVVHLISRSTTTLDQIDAQAQQATTQQEQQQAQQVHAAVFARFLDSVAKSLGGISVNPRYGTWSADQGSVVALTTGLSSPISSPAAAQPSLPTG